MCTRVFHKDKNCKFFTIPLSRNSQKRLEHKGTKPNIEEWPQSLRVMLEFSYIARGHLTNIPRSLDPVSFSFLKWRIETSWTMWSNKCQQSSQRATCPFLYFLQGHRRMVLGLVPVQLKRRVWVWRMQACDSFRKPGAIRDGTSSNRLELQGKPFLLHKR